VVLRDNADHALMGVCRHTASMTSRSPSWVRASVGWFVKSCVTGSDHRGSYGSYGMTTF